MITINKSEALYEEAKKYVLKVTPFRQPVLASAKGQYYHDVDGNRFLDMMAGQFCEVFGHSDDGLKEVVKKQMDKIIHTNTLYLSEEVLQAAKALASVTHETLNKTILLSTGAEAVECALRYAKFYTQRDGIVGVHAGYHGLTLATQSITAGGKFAQPKVPGTHAIPTPDWLHRDNEEALEDSAAIQSFLNACLEEARKNLESAKGTIAAFIVEPVISVGGMIYPPREYFEGLKALADEHEALFIFDECQTGLGRLGSWFGYEQTGVVPDILVLAKAAGLGIPVSAVVVNDAIAEAVEGKHIHFSSHQNDPLPAAILLYVIEYMQQQNMLSRIQETGDYFLQQLEALAKEEPWLQHPRGKGLMIGFDLPSEAYTAERNPGQELIAFLETEGVMIQAIRQGKTFRIIPAYTLERADIDFFMEKLQAGLRSLHS